MKKNVILLMLLWVGCLFAEDLPNTAACAACHGGSGISINPVWPNLAGQHTRYLIKQLSEFKAGKTRQAGLMMPFVESLTEDEIKNLAIFYSKKSRATNAPTKQNNQRGEQLYRVGDREKHITACIACHGPTGMGNGHAGFPVVAGQQSSYLVLQLKAFKAGTRSNDLNAIMRDIASRMSAVEMQAVSDYMTDLH